MIIWVLYQACFLVIWDVHLRLQKSHYPTFTRNLSFFLSALMLLSPMRFQISSKCRGKADNSFFLVLVMFYFVSVLTLWIKSTQLLSSTKLVCGWVPSSHQFHTIYWSGWKTWHRRVSHLRAAVETFVLQKRPSSNFKGLIKYISFSTAFFVFRYGVCVKWSTTYFSGSEYRLFFSGFNTVNRFFPL